MSTKKKLFLTFLLWGFLFLPSPVGAKEKTSETVRTIPAIATFKITGNTVFGIEELEKALTPFLGATITTERLSQIGQVLTNYYGERGYTASFARVLDRTITDGIIPIEIVEARIDKINVEVKGYLRSGYVRSRLDRKLKGQVFNNRVVERTILSLQQTDENIEGLEIEANLKETPRVAVDLNVIARAAPVLEVKAIASNTGSPSLGEIVIGGQFDTAVTGNGDRLIFSIFTSQGTDSYSGFYSFPVTARNGKIVTSIGQNTSGVIEDPFSFADIDVDSQSYSLSFVQPLIETPTERLSIGITGSLEQSIGTLEGERSQLFRGADTDGRLRVAALRLPIEYFTRDFNNIFTLQSQLNLGINAFDATTNEFGNPDGRFATLETNVSYARVFAPDTYALVRTRLQLANNSVPAFETIDHGGLNTVRGYRQSSVSTDNGLLLSLEAGIPIYRNEQSDMLLRAVSFVDFGTGWNTDLNNPELNNLVSTGVGLRFSWRDRVFVRLDYGIPLTNRDQRVGTRSLQDDGFHFGVVVTPIKF